MKKNILFLSFLLGCFLMNAQSIEFRLTSAGASVNGDTIIKTGSVTTADLEQKMYVTQSSGSTMDIKAKCYVQTMDTGRYTVCWFVCYAPQLPTNTYFAPNDAVSVNNNQVVDNFSAHYYHTSGAPATITQVRYVLYDGNNPSDSAYVDIKFDNNPTSVGDVSADNIELSAYPNPAVDFLNVKYNIEKNATDAVLSVYDVLGQEVVSRKINSSKGTERLNLSPMNAGVYFYAIKVNGEAIRTERFIVR